VSESAALPPEPRAQFRRCPRCGEALAAAGANPLACAACGFTFFFNPTVSAAAIVLRADGHALFIRRGHEPALGALAFVGGFIDAGESPEDALRREMREEVGIELAEVRYLCARPNVYPYRGVSYHVVDLIFVARAADGAQPRVLDGVAAVEWHDPRAVDPATLAFPSMTFALALYQRGTA
jgi:ADP-ribose pyrophosphatase YjhB (NUDIX family)